MCPSYFCFSDYLIGADIKNSLSATPFHGCVNTNDRKIKNFQMQTEGDVYYAKQEK